MMHGAQLWLALPDHARHIEPAFEHHTDLPSFVQGDSLRATLFTGTYQELRSPATVYSEQIGLDVELLTAGEHSVALNPSFEHGVMVVEGQVTTCGHTLEPGALCYLSTGAHELKLHAEAPARVLLIGGAPFGEDILIWWNFVARTRDEIIEARDAWHAHDERFGAVAGFTPEQSLRAPDVLPSR
jgi:redox-sensitive bicupin YhaK (pirin superfamily)